MPPFTAIGFVSGFKIQEKCLNTKKNRFMSTPSTNALIPGSQVRLQKHISLDWCSIFHAGLSIFLFYTVFSMFSLLYHWLIERIDIHKKDWIWPLSHALIKSVCFIRLPQVHKPLKLQGHKYGFGWQIRGRLSPNSFTIDPCPSKILVAPLNWTLPGNIITFYATVSPQMEMDGCPTIHWDSAGKLVPK